MRFLIKSITKKIIWIVILFLLQIYVFIPTAHGEIRIACLGNSITYGAGVVNREKNAWPSQLQNMLGKGYLVMNFGVSGTTLLRKGNSPYWDTQQYKEALNSQPNIVFIKLGTNDSKSVNRPFYNEFENDYKELIQSFKALSSNPRVVLLLPIPSFLNDSSSIFDPVIKNQIIPRIKNVAFETGCEIIDLYSLFIDKDDLVPDKIHPSSLGAFVIAKRLYEVVKLQACNSNIFQKIKEAKTISSFHGFECADFIFEGRKCKVVKPKKAVIGLPWVWRARFWGHEPQTDIAMLERGYHLVYMDVAELFGNAEAINYWNSFYKKLHKAGLSEKVILEGMSRGGVYVYNWALANPRKVACIYADAPVLDLKSWPGGKGKSKGSPEDWEKFKSDYGIGTEQQAVNFKNSPLDKAAQIAKLGIPLLHIVGDDDDVVPVDENTGPFEQIIKQNGGNITVIHKPWVKHHPHSLANPTQIVDFMLRAIGGKVNFAVIAAPGSEYRSGAGWQEGKDWWSNHEDIIQCMEANKPLDIVFLGNSITQSIGGDRKVVTLKPGKEAFDKAFAKYKWVTAGISGDRTQNLIWRIQNGSYEQSAPKLIVVMVGVNNITAGDSPSEITEGLKEVVKAIRTKIPDSKVLLLGPLPTGIKKDASSRSIYQAIHQNLSLVKFDKSVLYKNIGAAFIAPDGNLNAALYSGDGIHLNAAGYKIWANEILPIINEILK